MINCTEEVAKTKWCPQARASEDLFVNGVAIAMASVNRTGMQDKAYVDNQCKCLGSGCMAWIAGPGQDMVDPEDPERRFVAPNGRCGLINLRLTD